MADPSRRVPRPEVEARLARFVEALQGAGLDLAVVTTPTSVLYLTGIELGGFATDHALFVTADGAHRLVIREIEMGWRDHFREHTWCSDWSSYADDEDPAAVYGRAAASLRAGSGVRLGLELDRRSISAHAVRTITAAVGTDSVHDVSTVVETLRRTKSPWELDQMRAAGRLTVVGTAAAAVTVSDGGTDADAVAAAITAMLSAGSDFLADTPFVSCGPESARAHGRAAARRPDVGQTLTTMMTASFGRYQCPVERTFTVGEPAPSAANYLDICAAATAHVIDLVKPGMTSHDADGLARGFFDDHGCGDLFVHRLAYSIGIAFPPLWWENDIMQLRPNDQRVLEPGMTFHLVPGLHVSDVGFVNQSLPVVITETGCEPLLDLPLSPEPL